MIVADGMELTPTIVIRSPSPVTLSATLEMPWPFLAEESFAPIYIV
jgi:hypothetical protein